MMRPLTYILPTLFAVVTLFGTTAAKAQDSTAKTPPAAAENAPVPKGEVLRFTFENSRIFPGTFRDYWVYIPAQYTPDKPACLYVNQDGVQWRAPEVFDRLIANKEMPVTIGVFVMHGRVKAADPKAALDRFNRSLEYDGLGDNYARFLLEELLPEVEKQKATDGRAIRLSKSGNDRAIGGSSSGAVCAFTAAWERPDAFSRVFSAIGTYVGLRGADNYPTLIRKTEPKPLRVFLQDGSNDLNIYGGDWWMANQMMERALTFAGYEVNHVWGEDGHNGKQGTEVFPDAMRWLWKDWPAPVKAAGPGGNGMLKAIIASGEDWQAVGGEKLKYPQYVTSDPTGAVHMRAFEKNHSDTLYRVAPDGTESVTSASDARRMPTADAYNSDRHRYVAYTEKGEVVVYEPSSTGDKSRVVAKEMSTIRDLLVTPTGNVYIAQETGITNGSLWLLRPDGKKTRLAEEAYTNIKLNRRRTGPPVALALSPDKTLLYVAEKGSHWVWSYQIQADGTLKYGQRYYWLHSPDDADDAGAGGMAVDKEGRLYVATRRGIQICDQAGRVNVILPLPNGEAVHSLVFGGANFDMLYVAGNNAVYRRKVQAVGAPAFAAPLRPNPPGL